MKQVFHSEITLAEMIDFEAWSGAIYTHETILKANKIGELADLINAIFLNGAEDVKINDFLWFDSDFIFEQLGIENAN
jgi:hypothetical protein